MTAPKTDTGNGGTAVTTTKRTQLSPEQQKAVEERRVRGLMTQQIKGTQWGSGLDASTVSAIANWAHEHNIDPVTEIDVLGGKIYLNARLYERLLSQLAGAGQISYAKKDWIHVDKRIETLADGGDHEMKDESRRRMRARIQFNVPDEADAACVYRVRHVRMDEEVTGVKWHVPGKKKTIKRRDGQGTFEVDADPVGDQFPFETIETRALRRCMLQLKEAFPDLRVPTTKDEDTIDVAEVLEANIEEIKDRNQVRQITPGTSTLETEEVPVREAEPAMTSRSAVPEGLEEEDDGLTDQEIAELDARNEQQRGLGIDERKPLRSAQARGR